MNEYERIEFLAWCQEQGISEVDAHMLINALDLPYGVDALYLPAGRQTWVVGYRPDPDFHGDYARIPVKDFLNGVREEWPF